MSFFPQKSKTSPSQKGKNDHEKATKEELIALRNAEKIYKQGLVGLRDLLAPSSIEVSFRSIRIGEIYSKSFYVYTYPRFIEANWLAPVINLDATLDISLFIYPEDSAEILKSLRNKTAQMRSTIHMDKDRGVGRDPALEAALEDAEQLRDDLARGQEKFFQFGLYFTIYADDLEKIKKIQSTIQSVLGGKLILTKPADLQHEHGFRSTLPICSDEIEVYRNMNTSPLSTSFPFTSAELSTNEGILYGVNRHNNSLIIFDRFSLENANSVVFAKSGAGKSYSVKLEILRSLMLDSDVIIIDPENEYEALCKVIGGTKITVGVNAKERINPFDLPRPIEEEVASPGDLLRTNILDIQGLLRIMLKGLTPTEEGILDRALIDTYALKGITMDIEDPSQYDPPLLSDLQNVLERMQGAESLVERLSKYTTGSYAGIFNEQTNIDFEKKLLLFQVRDLEEELRPIAMHIILHFIWGRVRSKKKKRILVVDEAWMMMQYEDSAKFMYGLVKRARKYHLGVTTITQDVEDFLKSDHGKAIITNSSLQLLLKQSPSAADILADVFHLTEGEKYLLLTSDVGQGIFFAGLDHVAVQIIASYNEHKIITTKPEEMMEV